MNRFSTGMIGLICLLATALCLPSPAWSAQAPKKQGDLLLMYFAAGNTKRVFNLYRIKDKETLEYITGLAIIKVVTEKGTTWQTQAGLGYQAVADKLWGADPKPEKKTVKNLQLLTKMPSREANGAWGPISWGYFYEYAKNLNNPSVITFNKRNILVLNLDSIGNDQKKYLGDALKVNIKEWRITQDALYQALPKPTKNAIYAFRGWGEQSQGDPAVAAAATADLQKRLVALENEKKQLRESLAQAQKALAAAKKKAGTAERLDAESRESLQQANKNLLKDIERLTKEKINLQTQLTQAAKKDPQKAMLQILANVQGLSGIVNNLPQDIARAVEKGQKRSVSVPFPWGLLVIIGALIVIMTLVLYYSLRPSRRQGIGTMQYERGSIDKQFTYLNEQIQQLKLEFLQRLNNLSADGGQTQPASEGNFDLLSRIDNQLMLLNNRLVKQGGEGVSEQDRRLDALTKAVHQLTQQLKNQDKGQLSQHGAAAQGSTDSGGRVSLPKGQANKAQQAGEGVGSQKPVQPQDAGQGVSMTSWSAGTGQGGGKQADAAPPGQPNQDKKQPADSKGRENAQGALPMQPGKPGQAGAAPRASQANIKLAKDAAPQDAVIVLREGLRAEMDEMANDLVNSKFNTRAMGTYNKVADAMELLRNFFRPWKRQGEELRALNASQAGPLLEAWQAFRRNVVFTIPELEALLADTEESKSKLANVLKGVKAGNYQARIDEKLAEWRDAIFKGRQEGKVVQNRQNEELEKALVAFVRKHVLPFVDKWSVDKFETQPQFEDLKTLGITAKGFNNLLGEVKQKCGLEFIEPKPWEPFDNELHKVIEDRTVKGSHNQVAEVLQPGVRMYLGEAGSKGKSELLRQAKVALTVRG